LIRSEFLICSNFKIEKYIEKQVFFVYNVLNFKLIKILSRQFQKIFFLKIFQQPKFVVFPSLGWICTFVECFEISLLDKTYRLCFPREGKKKETSARSCLFFCQPYASWSHKTPKDFDNFLVPKFWTDADEW